MSEDPNADPPGNSTPESQPEIGGEGHDLNLEIPEWTMVPLCIALCGLMVGAFRVNLLLVSLLPFVVLLGVITVIDLRELRVPNKLVKPAVILALPLVVIASKADWSDLSISRALLGALVMGAGYFTLAMIYPPGMGFGDVKLSPIIGAQLGLFGWEVWFRGLFAAFLLVGPVAVLLLVVGKAGKKTGLPFAPFMAAGAILALVLEGVG